MILWCHGCNKYVAHSCLNAFNVDNLYIYCLLLKIFLNSHWCTLNIFKVNIFHFTFQIKFFVQSTPHESFSYKHFRFDCAWRLGKEFNIYPGLYTVKKNHCLAFILHFLERHTEFHQGALLHAVVWRPFFADYLINIFLFTQNITLCN